jgi:hypothetical protein
MLCVDEVNLETACFQDLVNGNPVNAGRLHRYRPNPALREPVCQRVQIASEGGKTAHRLRVSVSTHGDVQLAGAYINAGSIRVQYRQCVTSSLALLGHLLLRSCRSDARGADTEQTPNRDRRRNRRTSSHVCTQPQTHALRSGFEPGTNVGAGCSCHPTGWDHHRSTRVPLHPVWPRAASCTLHGSNPCRLAHGRITETDRGATPNVQPASQLKANLYTGST